MIVAKDNLNNFYYLVPNDYQYQFALMTNMCLLMYPQQVHSKHYYETETCYINIQKRAPVIYYNLLRKGFKTS